MAERSDSLRDRETRRLAVEICVAWFKDNGSDIGIDRLQNLVRDKATAMKMADYRKEKEMEVSGLMWVRK